MGVKRLGICLWMYVCAFMLVTFIATSPWQIFGKESLLQGHQSASVKKQKDKKKPKYTPGSGAKSISVSGIYCKQMLTI